MKARLILAALTFLTSALAQAAGVSSITARGHTITVGDTADSVFKVLKEKDMVNQDVEKTEDGLRLTKRYRVKDKAFVLVFVRSPQGDYVVSSVSVLPPPSVRSHFTLRK